MHPTIPHRLLRRAAALAAVTAISAVSAVLLGARPAAAQGGLPPVPVPPQNPITEEKRVLGKILFWDEQLSSDDTVACGTCHRPASAATDPRVGVHPGLDGTAGTPDDVLGSPGVARADEYGNAYPDPVFGTDVQVTPRSTPSFFGTQWAQQTFWDGRAGGEFVDPETGLTLLPAGGALENQALGPILNDVEMACENRDWGDVATKLAGVTPLALATDLPADMGAALAIDPTYGDLFDAAFGDPAITAARIAFAIATYERTLIPDQTPWDAFVSGDTGAMTAAQARGWDVFRGSRCSICHAPPFFTDNSFRNIGLRPIAEDAGRFDVTGSPTDRGRFKVPSLRNAALRPRLMHNGQRTDIPDVIAFYVLAPGEQHFTDNQDQFVLGGVPIPPPAVPDLIAFLTGALTDPRVAAESFPFDRPTLRSERATDAPLVALPPSAVSAFPNPFRASSTLSFALAGAGPVAVSVHDVTGALVRRVADGWHDRGAASFVWDGADERGRDVPAGVYFYRVRTATGTATERVVRLR